MGVCVEMSLGLALEGKVTSKMRALLIRGQDNENIKSWVACVRGEGRDSWSSLDVRGLGPGRISQPASSAITIISPSTL